MLEILHHDRVGTLVLQAFGPVSQLDRAIAQHGAGNSVLLGQFTIHRSHVFAFPGRARPDRQQMDILMPQAFARQRQLRVRTPNTTSAFSGPI